MNTHKEMSIFPEQYDHILLLDKQGQQGAIDNKSLQRLLDVMGYIIRSDLTSAEDIADQYDKEFPTAEAVRRFFCRCKPINAFLSKGKPTEVTIKNYLEDSIQSELAIDDIRAPEQRLIATDKLLTLGKIDSAIMILKPLEFAPNLHPDIRGRVFGRIADLLSIEGEYTRSIEFANKGLVEIKKRGTKARVLISFLHEIAARSYYYMGGKKNTHEALRHINESLECWNTHTLKYDARRAEQLALQARIISTVADKNHDIITRHFNDTYNIIHNESSNEHEHTYLIHLTDYNKLCYYLSCIKQVKLRPQFKDQCGELIGNMCNNGEYSYTPSEWFDLKEAQCIFNYHTMKNNPNAIIKSAAEALNFATRANIHGIRMQNIRTIFRELGGTSDDIKNAKKRNNELMNTAKLLHYLSCPMCQEFTGNDRSAIAYCGSIN